jgi:hypothetical protein
MPQPKDNEIMFGQNLHVQTITAQEVKERFD